MSGCPDYDLIQKFALHTQYYRLQNCIGMWLHAAGALAAGRITLYRQSRLQVLTLPESTCCRPEGLAIPAFWPPQKQ